VVVEVEPVLPDELADEVVVELVLPDELVVEPVLPDELVVAATDLAA
jgi:hypothetical protein